MTFLDKLSRSALPVHHDAHQAGTKILEISHLSVHYESALALEDVTFSLNAGDQVAVVGPNGAGKSTLFKVIAGVLALSQGEVKIYGQTPGGHTCIAYVPQRSHVDWDFPVNVADVVMMGRIGKLGLVRWPKPRDWDFVQQALEVVGLAGMSKRQISELSGGQQQRMFIARSLAQEAELMLMDEPFTGLDLPSQEDILLILERLHARGVTVLASTHDLNLAGDHFAQVLLLNHRIVGFGAPEQVFTTERLLQAFGGHLRLVQADNSLLALSDTCCEEEGVHDHPD